MDLSHHVPSLDAFALRQRIDGGGEIALLDVREAGQFGEGHPFHAVPVPYSRLELDIGRLVPRRSAPVVLLDDGDAVALRAARRLAALGYSDIFVVDGGAPAWAAAGLPIFKGVNVPSKTFGELVEHADATPRVSAAELREWQEAGREIVLVDGRTFEEHRRFAIPGAVSCPNAELAWRWRELAPSPNATIVVHCAGRTRSIVGAGILRALGVPNPVVALENGTQGWNLAGFEVSRGSESRAPSSVGEANARAARADARAFAARAGVPELDDASAQRWIDDPDRTTFVLDVRSAEEFAAGTLAGAAHAPGGQLLQATDQYVGVIGARILLVDDEGVRARVVAAWLARQGWEVGVLAAGTGSRVRLLRFASTLPAIALAEVGAETLAARAGAAGTASIDVRSSRVYRQGHGHGVPWSIRPRLAEALLASAPAARAVILIAEDEITARLAAVDLRETGVADIAWTRQRSWERAGLPVASTPADPADADAIDFLLFVHDRHDGNLAAAQAYLDWETGLIAQCTPAELARFRIDAAPWRAPSPSPDPEARP